MKSGSERGLALLGADECPRGRFVVPAHTVALERRRHDMRGYSVVYHASIPAGCDQAGNCNSRIIDATIRFLGGLFTRAAKPC
jgi:hypothetical protein